MLGGAPFGELVFAGPSLGTTIAPGGQDPGEETVNPFTVLINGVSYYPLIDTLAIEVESNQQGTASFTLCNIEEMVAIGQSVEIRFYQDTLFIGQLDRIVFDADISGSLHTYQCDCVDLTYLLSRKKIRKTYSGVNMRGLCLLVLEEFLGGDGLLVGKVDNAATIPLVDAQNISLYEVMRQAAMSLGLAFTINDERFMTFSAYGTDPTPVPVTDSIVEEATSIVDREEYRNVQTVIVNGTTVPGGEDQRTVKYSEAHQPQIQERLSAEQTNGIYSDIEEITHPTSNNEGDLLKLAVAYAKTLLSVNGEFANTLSVRTRAGVFRMGQVAPVSLPKLGISGDWIIQKLRMRSQAGRWLITDMDLSVTSVRRRQDLMWVNIVQDGKVTVVPPIAIPTNTQVFTSPGVHTFTVPAGVTVVQVTYLGAGGGGGGAAYHKYFFFAAKAGRGAQGGNGGKGLVSITVTPGQILTITVGAGGAGGISQSITASQSSAKGSIGGMGGLSKVEIGAVQYGVAFGGSGGSGATANSLQGLGGDLPQATHGGASGNYVTAGGGSRGGFSGLTNPFQNSYPGSHGSVTVEW